MDLTFDHRHPLLPASKALGVAVRICAAVAMLGPAAGCGGDDASETTKTQSAGPARKEQSNLDESGWKAELAGQSGLAALAAKVAQPFRAAGFVDELDGGRTLWAEFAASDDEPRTSVITIWQTCDAKGTCTRGQGQYTATGASLQDEAGADVAKVATGAPVLNKRLLEHNLTKANSVLVGAALDRKNPVDPPKLLADVAGVTWGTRRLLLLSAYGPQVGVTAANIVAAAEKTGLFERVDVVHFARRGDLAQLLPVLTPLDVVVWLGAGVVDTFTDGKPDKSVGMTLSRGVLGDQLIHRDNTKGLFDQPPVGGPGLIVLAGGDSLTSDFASQTGLLAQALQEWPLRPVVGFDGKLSLAAAEAGVQALLASLAAGKDLKAALTTSGAAATKANGALGSVAALSAVEPGQTEGWLMPVASSAFWSAMPSKVTLKLYLKVTPKCVEKVSGTCNEAAFKAGKAVTSGLTASTAIFECDATFTGPWFDCTTKNDLTGADFRIRGVMRGRAIGDGIYLLAQGSPDKKVRGIDLLGNGVIEAVDQGGGATTIRFGGLAAASLYLDADEHCCVAVTPTLVGQKSTEELSSFKILP